MPCDLLNGCTPEVRWALPTILQGTLGPKMINPGGNITATYTNRLQGRPTWLCYLYDTSPIGTSPVCGNPGTSYTITSSGSGSSTVQCTASETSASSIDLTWADSTQSNIRVRACTSSGDDLQYDSVDIRNTIWRRRKRYSKRSSTLVYYDANLVPGSGA